jgi:hypothetical protein
MPNPAASGLPNAASYDTSGPGVVVDVVTGLAWQRETGKETHEWAAANTYCSSLSLGDRTGWRLPKRIELVSLVDFMRTAPAIDASTFPETSSNFWTSSAEPGADPPTRAWQISFSGGAASISSVGVAERARCVATLPPADAMTPRYTIEAKPQRHGDGRWDWSRLATHAE